MFRNYAKRIQKPGEKQPDQVVFWDCDGENLPDEVAKNPENWATWHPVPGVHRIGLHGSRKHRSGYGQRKDPPPPADIHQLQLPIDQ